MKLAVLSDIHGNVPALEAVLEDMSAWGPDLVVMNGDLVSRGPYSRACLALLDQAFPTALTLRGNHEEYVLESAGEPPEAGTPHYELTRFARWCAAELGAATLARLARWPGDLDIADLEGGTVHVTHGSRLGTRSGIGASTPVDQLPERLGDPRDLFIVSHTHRPLLHAYHRTLIVNVGSVGTPMDGDTRSAYGRFTYARGHWRAEIRRVAYDRLRAQQDFIDSGFIEAGGIFSRIIFAELLYARVLAGTWMQRYHRAVMAGELDLAQTVAAHLEENECAEVLAR